MAKSGMHSSKYSADSRKRTAMATTGKGRKAERKRLATSGTGGWTIPGGGRERRNRKGK